MEDFVALNGVYFSNVNVKAKLNWCERIYSINEKNLNINLKDEIRATLGRLYTILSILSTGIIYVFILFPIPVVTLKQIYP